MPHTKEIYFELGIGTRMRRFMDMLATGVDKIYKGTGVAFKARYFYVFYALVKQGNMPISSIAALAGFSHSAVSQTVKQMVKDGLITTSATHDGRQKLVGLTEKGEHVYTTIAPIWQAIEDAMKDLIAASGTDFLGCLTKLEAGLQEVSFHDRVREKLAHAKSSCSFEIVPYDVQYRQAFYDLNAFWVEKYFSMEEPDIKLLSDPENFILSKGGEIYFAVSEGKAVGTVALKAEPDGRFELTKLGVDPRVQKGGMGNALCKMVIDRFVARGGKTLYLETNTSLENAIRLYWRLGFIELPNPVQSPYERANYYMEWRGYTNAAE
ncbi:bifunctional helix-turn-helix transcriptional regulator/GNAT family N-acetyltransferase [Kordiimonas pumila]|uniref:GNAT family N-acetyltransferase n=1 Tax=Kordiimonas pumila TaxID=2161677 RepID=A0ABV7D0J9_9PROT|nr:helix-turn-helix domain-containing GNAT family N-acetyltransferase [Kordiimonas pumila]